MTSFCRFESSSHAISMSAYLREQRRELYSKSGELQGERGDGEKLNGGAEGTAWAGRCSVNRMEGVNRAMMERSP